MIRLAVSKNRLFFSAKHHYDCHVVWDIDRLAASSRRVDDWRNRNRLVFYPHHRYADFYHRYVDFYRHLFDSYQHADFHHCHRHHVAAAVVAGHVLDCDHRLLDSIHLDATAFQFPIVDSCEMVELLAAEVVVVVLGVFGLPIDPIPAWKTRVCY
jgi:hypothetical protein